MTDPEPADDRDPSRWWVGVAMAPVAFVLWTVAAGDALAGAPSVLTSAVGLALTLLFPLAVFLDAAAVNRADGEWKPNGLLYGIVALVGVVTPLAFAVSIPVAVFYLVQRHRHVGVP